MVGSLGLGLIFIGVFMTGTMLLVVWKGSGDAGGLFQQEARFSRLMIPLWVAVAVVGLVLALVGLVVD